MSCMNKFHYMAKKEVLIVMVVSLSNISLF